MKTSLHRGQNPRPPNLLIPVHHAYPRRPSSVVLPLLLEVLIAPRHPRLPRQPRLRLVPPFRARYPILAQPALLALAREPLASRLPPQEALLGPVRSPKSQNSDWEHPKRNPSTLPPRNARRWRKPSVSSNSGTIGNEKRRKRRSAKRVKLPLRRGRCQWPGLFRDRGQAISRGTSSQRLRWNPRKRLHFQGLDSVRSLGLAPQRQWRLLQRHQRGGASKNIARHA